MPLLETLQQVKVELLAGNIRNEAEVCNGIILPILQGLGWPVFSVAVVVPQNSVPTLTPGSSRVVPDYQLCNDGTALIFLEAKRLGAMDGDAEIQLFEQCFHARVSFAVLTDGREWRFYLPFHMSGNQTAYADCKVYTLHLLEQDDEECVGRLDRYLSRERVNQGHHLASAQNDLDATVRASAMQQVLPQAWAELLSGADTSIIETLAEKVSELCGFEPDPNICADFLAKQATGVVNATAPREYLEPVSKPTSAAASLDFVGFSLRGETQVCASAIDVMVQFLTRLAADDPTFLERLESRNPTNRRAVRYVARDRRSLYSTNPEKGESASREVGSGWFVSTHRGPPDIERVVQIACEVANLQFGSDVVISL